MSATNLGETGILNWLRVTLDRFIFQSLSVLCVLCGEISSVAAEEALSDILPIDGPRFQAEPASIDARGQVNFSSGRPLRIDELVRYGHPVDPRPQPLVLLAGGSRIVAAAAWAGGAPVALAGRTLTLQSDLLNELRIPSEKVRGIVFGELRHPDDRRQLETAVWAASELKSDEVLLSNDERLRGSVTQIDRGTLTMTTDAGEAKLPLSRVLSVTRAARRVVDALRIARGE
jgi:hypothetical protein